MKSVAARFIALTLISTLSIGAVSSAASAKALMSIPPSERQRTQTIATSSEAEQSALVTGFEAAIAAFESAKPLNGSDLKVPSSLQCELYILFPKLEIVLFSPAGDPSQDLLVTASSKKGTVLVGGAEFEFRADGLVYQAPNGTKLIFRRTDSGEILVRETGQSEVPREITGNGPARVEQSVKFGRCKTRS